MSTTEPTIISARIHYGEPVVTVEHYRTTDRFGGEVLVREFVGDSGNSRFIDARGAKIRKDGNPANQHQVLPDVTIPANVKAALDRLQ